MNNVLLLGAGMVAKPIADYLLENNIEVTIASRTVSKAEELIKKRKNGKAIAWAAEDLKKLETLVANHDLTVSLLPYAFHVAVAKLCIKHKKNMLTTSYVSPEMIALDLQAKQAGIIILNEIDDKETRDLAFSTLLRKPDRLKHLITIAQNEENSEYWTAAIKDIIAEGNEQILKEAVIKYETI